MTQRRQQDRCDAPHGDDEARRRARERLAARQAANSPRGARAQRSQLPQLPQLPRRPLLLVLLAALLLIAAVMGVRSCVGCAAEAPAADQQPTADQQSQGEGSGAPDTADEPATIDEAALRTSLGNDPEAELQKLLKLAENDPQAYKFVAEFPDNYPMEAGEPCTDEVSSGEVPLLLQWDARWGYTVYCSSAFGMTGCGPTSMAMVYQGLTGKNDLTPYDMGQIAQQEGYMYTYSGTDTAFFTAVPARWGISVVQVGVSEVALTEALRSGAVVICNVGPGDFTTDGHFIVLTGLDDEGRLVVNDPYSTVRSEQHWDVSQVISQTRALWAFSI